jgi:hypothetical protein
VEERRGTELSERFIRRHDLPPMDTPWNPETANEITQGFKTVQGWGRGIHEPL